MRRDVNEIDWTQWQPTEQANLCFVIQEGRILLIRKKRGLGAGKINGPGGRLEPGETPVAAAVRECQEELGITPTGLREAGELFFDFTDGYKLHVFVFAAAGFTGELIETDEARPLWFAVEAIPYGEMWQDDPFWLPLVLMGKHFRGYFIFEGETMLSWRVVTDK